MTISTKKTWLLVSQIFLMISGICACLTLIGAAIGVPAIIAATKFAELRKLDDEKLKAALEAKTYIGWGIFSLFAGGLFSILAFIFVYGMETKE